MLILAVWALIAITYSHQVTIEVQPTYELCMAARAFQAPDVRDSYCIDP